MFYSTKSLNSDKISHTANFCSKNKAGDRVNVITMEDWKNGEMTIMMLLSLSLLILLLLLKFRMFLIWVIDKGTENVFWSAWL